MRVQRRGISAGILVVRIRQVKAAVIIKRKHGRLVYEMNKKRIAVIFGGNSAEYEVSLQSASAVLENLDENRFDIIPIGITRNGEWYHYTGKRGKIRDNTWFEDSQNLFPVIASQSRSVKGFLELMTDTWRVIETDLIFPVLHGKNGEDGTIQGLFELAGIPVVGCDMLSSALCMDKNRAHKLVSLTRIAVPRSVTFRRSDKEAALQEIDEDLTCPLFVKPVRSGSSFGITKIMEKPELDAAIELAFAYDTEVIVEEAVSGFEAGCAILGREGLTVGRVDEIELTGDFFDYTQKYTLASSKIHMPARISAGTERRIQEAAVTIYRTLGCSGFARVDMFYTPDGEIIFNEVNTIPGFTSHSRFPNMMRGIGLSFPEMLERLIGLYVE